MVLKSFCISQLPHKSVNLSFTITNVKNNRAGELVDHVVPAQLLGDRNAEQAGQVLLRRVLLAPGLQAGRDSCLDTEVCSRVQICTGNDQVASWFVRELVTLRTGFRTQRSQFPRANPLKGRNFSGIETLNK